MKKKKTMKTKWMERKKSHDAVANARKKNETMRSEPNRWWFTKHFSHYTFRWKWTRKLVKIRGNRISAYYYIVSNGTMWLDRVRVCVCVRSACCAVRRKIQLALYFSPDKVQRRGISCRSLTRFDGHKNKIEYIEVYGPMFAIDFHIDNCIVSAECRL